jgi:prefoldin subunit 5
MLDPNKINYTVIDVAKEMNKRTEALIDICESQNNMIAKLHDRITKLEDQIDNILENQQ